MAATTEDLREATAFARERGVPMFILGGGSNLLVADAGFLGLVIRVEMMGVHEERQADTVVICAGAGGASGPRPTLNPFAGGSGYRVFLLGISW